MILDTVFLAPGKLFKAIGDNGNIDQIFGLAGAAIYAALHNHWDAQYLNAPITNDLF